MGLASGSAAGSGMWATAPSRNARPKPVRRSGVIRAPTVSLVPCPVFSSGKRAVTIKSSRSRRRMIAQGGGEKSRAARSRIAWNTGSISRADRLMRSSTSKVASCCLRDSRSSPRWRSARLAIAPNRTLPISNTVARTTNAPRATATGASNSLRTMTGSTTTTATTIASRQGCVRSHSARCIVPSPVGRHATQRSSMSWSNCHQGGRAIR